MCTIKKHLSSLFMSKAILYITTILLIDKPTTLVLGMCWWFSLTAKLISMFLRYCWSFFTVFCWLKSLAHKKIEILCLLSVKDIYESPFVYVWTFRFHCLLILYLYDFPCFKYSLTMADGHHSNLWNLLLNLLLNWSDYAMLLQQRARPDVCK